IGSRVHIGNAHRVLGEVLITRVQEPDIRQTVEEHFTHAVGILAGMKNELELARVYRAYAVFREHIGMADEAARLRQLADEIYLRLRGAASQA
ncbi:MAG: hypothetical protein AAGC55_26210, partial [Myxococcota bacterium]